MSNKGSRRADSMLALRNRLPVTPGDYSLWACVGGEWIIPKFFLTLKGAEDFAETLLEQNITATPKRVNITITFPSTP